MWSLIILCVCGVFFFFKQKTAYEMRISDWSSDVCSSDLEEALYMHVLCDYLETYPYYLDPTVTRMAMDNIQLFINVYPTSTHVAECNGFLEDRKSVV